MYSNTKVAEITIDNVLYALDSTTISTSIVLAAWALGKYSKGTVKMHTLLDLRGSIPANIHITDGKWHDSNELDEIVPELFAFYMMDKAYVDFIALFRFHKAGAYWISRPKDNMRYEVVNHRLDFDPSTGILITVRFYRISTICDFNITKKISRLQKVKERMNVKLLNETTF